MTTIHDFGGVLGRPLDTFFLGSHNFMVTALRATSHTILRAYDHYTSSTLIGGKGGAGPSSLHNTHEGQMEYTSECEMDVRSTWIPTWH